MAVLLGLVGVLLGVGFSAVGAYLDDAKQNHTQNSLEVTKQALLNFERLTSICLVQIPMIMVLKIEHLDVAPPTWALFLTLI
jgi:coproporphyrinogen III oxidase-like Fe-S oxidoreductase